jgi:hypothetical protein
MKRVLLIAALGLVALATTAVAADRPIFFKIKSTVTIDSKAFPTPTTYTFEGGTSAGGAGFQLSRCRFGRLVRLHYVTGSSDVVVGSTRSVRPPDGGFEGVWSITVPRPVVPAAVYAEVPKRKVKQGVCRRDTSPRISG